MLKQHPKILTATAQIVDIIVLGIAFFLAFPLRHFVLQWLPYGSRVEVQPFVGIPFMQAFLWWMFLRLHGTYGPQRLISFGSLIGKVFRTAVLATLTLFSIIYITKWTKVPRTLVISSAFLSFSGLLLEKYLWLRFLEYLRRRGKGCSDILIVGATGLAKQFVNSVNRFSDWGVRIVGFLVGDMDSRMDSFCNAPVLGTFRDLSTTLHRHPVDEVIFALPASDLEDVQEMLEVCQMEGVKTRIISNFFRGVVFKADADVVHGIPIITYSPAPMKDWQLFAKRTLDIFLSLAALIILLPLLTVLSLLVKLTSQGPLFYRWKVAGRNKKPVTSYKFRTMVVNADELKEELWRDNEMTGPVFKMRRDPRVTGIGRVLRKFSLDELPELWSVLKGDLSLVGPHPPLESELYRFDDWHRRKLSVKPGLTCLWQINGRNRITDFDEWVSMDLEYIDNWSLWMDFKILLKTIPAVLLGTGM